MAQIIRYCWCHDELISLLPANKQLVVGDPLKETIKLMSSRTFFIKTINRDPAQFRI